MSCMVCGISLVLMILFTQYFTTSMGFETPRIRLEKVKVYDYSNIDEIIPNRGKFCTEKNKCYQFFELNISCINHTIEKTTHTKFQQLINSIANFTLRNCYIERFKIQFKIYFSKRTDKPEDRDTYDSHTTNFQATYDVSLETFSIFGRHVIQLVNMFPKKSWIRLKLGLTFRCKENSFGERCEEKKCQPLAGNYECDRLTDQPTCLLTCTKPKLCFWVAAMSKFECVLPYDIAYQGCSPACEYPLLCRYGLCICLSPFRLLAKKCVCDAFCAAQRGVSLCHSEEETTGICNNCSQCPTESTVCTRNSALCKCKTGFKGNPISGCIAEADDAKACPRGQRRLNGQCILSFSGPREKRLCKPAYLSDFSDCIRDICTPECHRGAICIGGKCECSAPFIGNGIQCKCMDGYQEDLKWGCVRVSCPKKCHKGARCVRGMCLCMLPYTGNGESCGCINGYFQDSEGICRKEKGCIPDCGSGGQCKNGICVCRKPYVLNGGICSCKKGYYDDPDVECIPECLPKCHPDAHCNRSLCMCNSGFTGNGLVCFNCNRCVTNSTCEWRYERCTCNLGFMGNGLNLCYPNCNPACHPQANCLRGQCKCIDNYQGDGVNLCVNCARCHKQSICTPLGCTCKDGFQGNGYGVCHDVKSCHPACPMGASCVGQKCICDFPFVNGANDDCKCAPGYQLNESRNGCAKLDCFPACGSNAHCANSKCQCDKDFVFDPSIGACFCPQLQKSSSRDFDNGKSHGICDTRSRCHPQCHPRGICSADRCACKKGSEGNGVTWCFNCGRCGGQFVKCDPLGERCVCLPGYEGLPYRGCTRAYMSTCLKVAILAGVTEAVIILFYVFAVGFGMFN